MPEQVYHAMLVAGELQEVGFITDRIDASVHISLEHRKVSKMEIEAILDDIFEGCSFKVESVSDGIKVTVE